MHDTTTTDGYGRDETRRRILDAAWRLVETEGVAITMSQVAAAAEVSRQAVYLHFDNRSGMLVGLLGHIDDELGLAARVGAVRDAPTGRAALVELVALHAEYTAEIIGVARLADAARHGDEAVAVAWEDRMAGRRRAHLGVVQRIADDGDLAPGWDVESAAMLFHAWTMPGAWDELVTERGWSTEDFRDHVTRALTSAFVTT